MNATVIITSLIIFVARVADVSLGTVRLILLSRGIRGIASIIGFIEITIWLVAVSRIFMNLDNWIYYIAYALGFATGTYAGVILEEKISLGKVIIRIVAASNSTPLFDKLNESRFTSTTVAATGPEGNINIIHIVLNRRHIKNVISIIDTISPESFYSIEDIRYVRENAASSVTSRAKFFKFFNHKK